MNRRQEQAFIADLEKVLALDTEMDQRRHLAYAARTAQTPGHRRAMITLCELAAGPAEHVRDAAQLYLYRIAGRHVPTAQNVEHTVLMRDKSTRTVSGTTYGSRHTIVVHPATNSELYTVTHAPSGQALVLDTSLFHARRAARVIVAGFGEDALAQMYVAGRMDTAILTRLYDFCQLYVTPEIV